MARVSTYLYLPRSTEPAFLFYKSVFGGEFNGPMQRFADVPAAPGQPPMAEDDKALVMHVALAILAGHVLLGTDARESMVCKVTAGDNMHINLEPDSRAETNRLFAALAAGGKIDMPLQAMFWGGYFGWLADAFGVCWMSDCAGKS